MKSSAVFGATLLFAILCFGVGAEAKEKKPGGQARSGGAPAGGCDPADLEGCTAWAERQLAADPGDMSFDSERKEAQGHLRTACAGGVQRACSKLADSLERLGPAIGDDALRVITLRTRTCEAGDARDCEKLGGSLLESRGLQNSPEAARVLRKACDAKRTTACLRLASVFESGQIGVPDPAAGLKLREKACDLGDADACDAAADSWGRGVNSKDAKKARALDEKACALGRGASCSGLSRAEASTAGGKKTDPDKALEFLRKACDGGDGNACWELSRLTSAGQAGGPRDDDKAVDLMLLACAQGKVGEECRDATVASLRTNLPPLPPAPEPPPRAHNWVPVLVAAGLAALAGGAGLQQAISSQEGANDLKLYPSADSLVKRQTIDTSNKRSRVLYATAGALAAVTVTFYFVF